MGMKQGMVIGLGCFLLGAVCARLAMTPSAAKGPVQNDQTEQVIAENKSLRSRLAQTEEGITSLEAELETARARQRGTGDSPHKAELSVRSPAPQDAPAKQTARNVADVAKLLGLEPGRQKHFEESYERVRSMLLDAEKRHATVSRQGGEAEVHIPPFPEEGGALRREWSNVVASALTSFEQERYKTLGFDQVLFPREIGLWDRYMVFESQENADWPKVINGSRLWPMYQERWSKPGEPAIDPSTRWPWSGPEAYECYRHLTKP